MSYEPLKFHSALLFDTLIPFSNTCISNYWQFHIENSDVQSKSPCYCIELNSNCKLYLLTVNT